MNDGSIKVKNGNWIPVDKNIIDFKEKGKPYTKIEAYISLRIDIDNNQIKGLREYSRIWDWSAKKVHSFFKIIGFNQRKHFGNNVETDYRLIILDLDNDKVTKRKHLGNTTNKTNTNTSNKKDMFLKPTIEELEIYAKQIDYDLNAESFFNSYEQKNWMVGKNKMKDWKAAVRNWKANKWGEKPESRKDLFY